MCKCAQYKSSQRSSHTTHQFSRGYSAILFAVPLVSIQHYLTYLRTQYSNNPFSAVYKVSVGIKLS